MKALISDALKFENNRLWLLDQTRLPHSEHWLPCDTAQQIFDAIVELKVRGAPLIGVAASLFVGKYAGETSDPEALRQTIHYLISSRPTAVNLQILLQQHLDLLDGQAEQHRHMSLAAEHFHEDQRLCRQIADFGSNLIPDKTNILTHCNSGSLATAGVGTALGVIKQAGRQKNNIQVYVDETRPLLQGARLTAWELAKHQVKHRLICDNMAAFLMQQGKVDMVILGADRICANGDFANKIGTYNLAVLARYHQIPFYVAAPYTTIDFSCLSGSGIPIEQRQASEVTGFSNREASVNWSPENTQVYNPAFDVTPGALVTGFILDTGVYQAGDINGLK